MILLYTKKLCLINNKFIYIYIIIWGRWNNTGIYIYLRCYSSYMLLVVCVNNH